MLPQAWVAVGAVVAVVHVWFEILGHHGVWRLVWTPLAPPTTDAARAAQAYLSIRHTPSQPALQEQHGGPRANVVDTTTL